MNLLPCALRLARRELRGGVAGFRVFLACLVLGVGAIAGIGSIAAAVDAGITADARDLLGGDVEARLAYRPADAAERQFLGQSGTVSGIATLRAMARRVDGGGQSLIALKAIDAAYPLYGRVALAPAQPLEAALERRDGVFGAAVDPALPGRLGLKPGDRIKIGAAVLQIRATIAHEPDAGFSGLAFGPRVLISQPALAATGLIRPGALVTYEYRLRLPPGSASAAWISRAQTAFPSAGWELHGFADAAPSLRRLIDRVGMFLSLVGLSALLVGGVGISNAVRGYIAQKTPTIATLKCLGAPARLVQALYLITVAALALFGIAAALGLGALLPLAAAPLLARVAPVAPRLGLYLTPLALAALFGALTTVVFSLWPLAAVARVPAGALFRDVVDPAARRRRWPSLTLTGAAALGLAALAVLSAGDRILALWFVAGAAAALALFWAAGRGLVAVARRLGRPRQPALQLALANLCRPGAPTAQLVPSLGIGLTVLVAIALIEGNLSRLIDEKVPAEAPAFFFLDIQPDQLAGFTQIVRQISGAHFTEVPMMRGRITRLNGVPVETATVAPGARWALRSDRGITYAATPPPGAELTAGSWWPPDYKGPPLVSFDDELAHGMGLGLGSTVTVNLLGREITAQIANLRHIDWQRLGINFVMVFAPGTFEAAPQTHLAAVYLPQAAENELVRQVSDRFPNVSAIPVREALGEIDRVIRLIATAVRLSALVTLLAGVLVLGGAVAAGHRRRVYEAVVLKVLGATRADIARAFVIEHGMLGALVAVLASVFGTIAAWFVVTDRLDLDWVFLPRPLVALVALAILFTLVFGFAATWAALGAKPAHYLRNE